MPTDSGDLPARLPACILQAGWLRLNVGALNYRQGDYAGAARQWRMALDATPPAYRRLRLNAQRNVGLALARLGRYAEAAEAFGGVMAEGPDHQAGLNLVASAAALGDVELMRSSFVQLLQVLAQSAAAAAAGSA